jgi:hypothetical protein
MPQPNGKKEGLHINRPSSFKKRKIMTPHGMMNNDVKNGNFDLVK